MSASSAFRRYLSPAFVSALHQLVDRPEGQWWRDALTHSDLKFAIRNDALDVYYCGASIFRVAPQDGRIVARTHFKYLVRQRQGYASIAADGWTFIHDGAPLWPAYEGRVTLEEMLDAAKPLAGPEKTGLHPLILYPRVIDLEVAFRSVPDPQTLPLLPDYEDAVTGEGAPSEERLSEGERGPRQDRLDAVTLEERGGELWIVFHEAKHFANPELRAAPSRTPPVVAQIARYRRSIEHYAGDIAASYLEVCSALRELRSMRTQADPSGHAASTHWDELIARVADGDALHVDPEPRLIVFGFDDDQKRGSTWRHHRARLEEGGLTVHAVGRPNKKVGATAFSRRPPASVEAGDAS